MAQFIPFRAYMPAKGLEEEIVALPYDVYSREEAYEEVRKHPGSFLAIDRPETQFEKEHNMYASEVYEKAAQMLQQWMDEGRFVQQDAPVYYLYRQIMNGRSQTGIVGCASIDDYVNQIIKKHENTRADKEEDRIRHVDTCNAQTGPIFLAYRSREELSRLVDCLKREEPEYDYVAEDGVRHTVWIVKDEEDNAAIRNAFAQMNSLYIADGHHRCASAVKVGLKRREAMEAANRQITGKEAFQYFLAVCFADEELKIMDYNRVVKDLNGMDKEAFLDKVAAHFTVKKVGTTPYAPAKKGTFGMYLEDEWYELTAQPTLFSTDCVAGLDVSILQDYLLNPILGIQDPRTDKRIDFVGGIRGLKELERRVHKDMKVAFSMYPTSIAELFEVADAGRLMPPKSTWFEPKLRSGMFIHTLDGAEESIHL